LRHRAPRDVFEAHVAGNNARILGPQLDNGREIAAERTAIHCALMAHWAADQHGHSGYDRPFAVVAHGGTGRGEMTPCSDADFALLFDDSLDDNEFLHHLQRQLLETGDFASRYGFSCQALPFNLEEIPTLDSRQLNSFLDLRPIYDPSGLAQRFRQRLQETYDPFLHFLFVHEMWGEQCLRESFPCEQLDQFDITMDGLRSFLAGIWVLAGKSFVPCREIYASLGDSRDLDAYSFLLRIRALIHLQRGTRQQPTGLGRHPEDTLHFDDFTSFGRLLHPEAPLRDQFTFANRVRARLLSARRRTTRFAQVIINQELSEGREIRPESPLVYGRAGLRSRHSSRTGSIREKSRSALELLLEAQRYELTIDPLELDGTFHEAGEWLVQTPNVAELFYEPNGSLADTFAFLAQLDGAETRLFPGHANFEVSLDKRIMEERSSLRGALVRRKIRHLESFVREGRDSLARKLSNGRSQSLGESDPVPEIAAQLDDDHLAALKLALKTKRLPLTKDDTERRDDASLPLYERYSSGFSGIPLQDYYRDYLGGCGFPEETLRITEFLVENRRAFKTAAQAGPQDAQAVREFAELCGSEDLLRTLYVFTCADRSEWESEREDPVLWFNIRELFTKTLARFEHRLDPEEALRSAGYSPTELSVLKDFNRSLLVGGYAQYGIQFGEHLARLALEDPAPPPKARLIRKGASTILAVAAPDTPGLAAILSGTFWQEGVLLRQANLFSSETYRIALDFFHLAPLERSSLPRGLVDRVEKAIESRLHIGEDVRAQVPVLDVELRLSPWRSSFRLSADTAGDIGGMMYALTYHVYHGLGGNVHGVSARARRGTSTVSVYFWTPRELSLDEARQNVASWR